MKDNFIRDLPVYIHGFAIGCLMYGQESIGIGECVYFILAIVSFAWYKVEKSE